MNSRHAITGLAAAALAGLSTTALAFTVDGRISAGDAYVAGVQIDATVLSKDTGDGIFTGQGQLLVGRDGPTGDVFALFDLGRDFVDNSYGAGSIGWKTPNDGGAADHTFAKLVSSDKLQFKVNGADVEIDYIKDFSGTFLSEIRQGKDGGGTVTEAATSLEFNVNDAAIQSAAAAAGLDILQDSPIPATPAQSDGSAIAARYADIEGSSTALNRWVFDTIYELRIKGSAFSAGNSVDFLNQVAANLVLGTVHASPNKQGGDNAVEMACTPSTNPNDPSDGSGGNCTPVNGGTPPGPGTSVPEPGTTALLLLGLTGIALRRRASR